MRDDFAVSTKNLLARRVGYKCSNPYCRKSTYGPHKDQNKHINIGVAAHITAASEGGPRFDPNENSDYRKSHNNGIWLCQSCAKLIDSDCTRYSVTLLETWKSTSEQLAIAELQTSSQSSIYNSDKDLVLFYAQCFDRPAFNERIREEGSIENLDKAIEDTIIALNTGVLRTREGEILKSKEGKSCVSNLEWRIKLDTIVDMLIAIRTRLSISINDGSFHISNNDHYGISYCFRDHELERWFDSSRHEILKIFSSICIEAGVHFYLQIHKSRHW